MTHEQRTYRSDRADGRFLSTLGFSHHLLKSCRPKLAFDPDMSMGDWQSWRAAVCERVRALMSLPEVPVQPQPTRLWAARRDGYVIEKWEAYPEPGSVIPLLLLVPDSATASQPAPAVMCFPGSASSKELLAGEPELDPAVKGRFPEHNRMAWWYARAGVVALAIENPGTGELADGDAGAVGAQRNCLSVDLVFSGRSYLGLSVFQKLCVLDWFASLDVVDATRIAVSGHSLGTEPAMMLGLLDDRIQAMVFNDFLCNNRQRIVSESMPGDTRRHWCTALWHLVAGLLEWVDFPDVLAAFAPRPLIITEGGVTTELRRVAEAYRVAGAPECFRYHYYPKYEKPEQRRDDEAMPEGLTMEEYFEYANVDAPNHYFKEHLAVPWLTEVFSGTMGAKRCHPS